MANLPPAHVTGTVGMRDVARLTELIDRLRAPAPAGGAGDVAAPDAETCKRALRAFRKRLALTRLKEESKPRRAPLSKGSGSGPAAITSPTEWPDSVWR